MIPDHLIDRAAAVHAEHIGSRAQADGFFMPIKRGQLPLPQVAIEAMERALSAVAAALIEKEADESPSVDYAAMWWDAERRAEKAEAERDRWHSMWRQRRIKHLAPADITLHSANSADWVRVRVEHPALGVIEEGIPLPTRSVPNVFTDAMIDRARKALRELHEDGGLLDGSTVAHQRAAFAVLTAAFTEPQQRPEGAEEIEALIDRAGTEGEGADNESLADYLTRCGVRVVGECDAR